MGNNNWVISEAINISNFLSNGPFDRRWFDLVDINEYAVENSTLRLIKSFEKNGRLTSDGERLILWTILKSLPTLNERSNDSSTIKKYANVDICPWKTFQIDKFDTRKLNDPMETKWFANFISAYHPGVSSFLARSLRRRKIAATFTTLSDANIHYMCSNYSENYQNWIEYDKRTTFEKFDALLFKNVIPIRGFVRYGDHKMGFMSIYSELRRKFPSSRALSMALYVMCFFVKDKCMKTEEEYRFIAFGTTFEELKDIPIQYMCPLIFKPIVKNNFYRTISHSSRNCGCDEKNWSSSSKDIKVCSKK